MSIIIMKLDWGDATNEDSINNFNDLFIYLKSIMPDVNLLKLSFCNNISNCIHVYISS